MSKIAKIEISTMIKQPVPAKPENHVLRQSGFFKVAEPLLVNLGKRQLEAALADLRDLIEAHAL